MTGIALGFTLFGTIPDNMCSLVTDGTLLITIDLTVNRNTLFITTIRTGLIIVSILVAKNTNDTTMDQQMNMTTSSLAAKRTHGRRVILRLAQNTRLRRWKNPTLKPTHRIIVLVSIVAAFCRVTKMNAVTTLNHRQLGCL